MRETWGNHESAGIGTERTAMTSLHLMRCTQGRVCAKVFQFFCAFTAFLRGKESYVYISKSCSAVGVGLQSKKTSWGPNIHTPHLRVGGGYITQALVCSCGCVLEGCLPLRLHLKLTSPVQRETSLQCKSKRREWKRSGNALQMSTPYSM